MVSPREKKRRDVIAPEVAAAVLFAANRTCCKCRVFGKPVQIHHIDDDPANNARHNLCILCPVCHNETLLKGGFGRQLDAAQVREFRNDWNRRVQSRRDEADRLAASAMRQSSTRTVVSPGRNAHAERVCAPSRCIRPSHPGHRAVRCRTARAEKACV